MPVIGQGTYGCVHKPPLKCSKKSIDNTDDKISKILNEDDAKKELKEFKLLKKHDKSNKHYLGFPESCKPAKNTHNVSEVSQCDKFTKDLTNTKLLIMKDGGPDLDSTLQYISKQSHTDQNHLLNTLFVDFVQIFNSVKYLTEKKLSHRDIKNGNIVYKNNKMKLIDFGLMRDYKSMTKESKDSRYSLNNVWWSVSPINVFMNQNKYQLVNKENANEIGKITVKRYMNDDKFLSTAHMLNIKPKCLQSFLISIESLIEEIPNHSHDEYLEKAFPCIDIFNIGLTLFKLCIICKKAKLNLSKSLSNDIIKLSCKLIKCNVFSQITISEATRKYEKILSHHNLKIKSIKSSPIAINHIISGYNSYTKVNDSNFDEYTKHCDKQHVYYPLTDTCIKKCNSSQVRNITTKRCNKKCKSHQKRNKTFKCRSLVNK